MIFGCTLFWIDFSPDCVTYYHLVCFPCFSSTSCSICYVFTIQASVRRRLRRARAVARYKWWLYRTGGIDRRLHVPVLSWILRTLSGHHSRDFKHLSTVQRHLKAAMAYTESQPWRCGPCKRLVKAKPQFCPNCGSWWEDVYDRSYQPSMQRHAEDQSWTWNAWQDSSQRRPKTPARRQSRSSSARRKGKRAEKGKEKGKEKGREKGKDKGTVQGNRSDLTLLQHSDVATTGTNAIHDGNDKQWLPISTWCGTHCRHQEGLSGFLVAPCGDQGGAGQNGGCCHQRPPPGYIGIGPLGRAQKSLRELEEAKEKHRDRALPKVMFCWEYHPLWVAM